MNEKEQSDEDENHTIPIEKPKKRGSTNSPRTEPDDENKSQPSGDDNRCRTEESAQNAEQPVGGGGGGDGADIETIELTTEQPNGDEAVALSQENFDQVNSVEQVEQGGEQEGADLLNQTQEDAAGTGGESGDESGAQLKKDGATAGDSEHEQEYFDVKPTSSTAAAKKEAKRKTRAHKHDSNLIPEEVDDEVSIYILVWWNQIFNSANNFVFLPCL